VSKKNSRERKPSRSDLSKRVSSANTVSEEAEESEVLHESEIPTIDELQDVSTMFDEDLMKLCQEGDEGAFEVLFQRYESQILSFIQRMTGDSSRVEATAQEAFLRIFKDSQSYQYPRNFKTWFYTIIRNLCKNDLRWRSRHPTLSIEDGAGSNNDGASERKMRIGDSLKISGNDPLENLVQREMNQKLQEALSQLTELDREILIMSRFQNLKYKEIAKIVDVPVTTVRARICATLEQLRKAVKDYME
jgi:RNA polymerase sigma-70 factor (ECF subfamily)